jgi:regulator of sirC expression with transglutaminase-like and TPR domain
VRVESQPLSAATREALAGLLDDPSPVVRQGVLKHLQESGDAGRDFLRELAEGTNRVRALHARWFLMELKFTDPVNEFRGFIRSLGYELETGMFLLGRTIYPEIDIASVCGEIDRIAARCRELTVEPATDRERCKVINRVLFHEMGFRGNVEEYADPENSFLHRVLERRKGLPITLSVLYLLVASRCGLQLEPVGLPGHFLVGCYEEDGPFFIDSFDHGRFLSPDDVLAYLEQRKIPMHESYLAPVTVREVLCRCCRNLASHFAASQQPPLARLFASFVEEFEAAYEERTNS